MYCPNCGKEIPDGAKFCPYCGINLNNKIDEHKQNNEIINQPSESKGIISKLFALLGLISFLLFAQLSCGPINFNGINLFSESLKDLNNSYSIGFIIVFFIITFSLIISISSGKSVITRIVCGITSLITNIIFAVAIKNTEGGFLIKFEFGYYLSIISFIFVIIGDYIEKLLIKNQLIKGG